MGSAAEEECKEFSVGKNLFPAGMKRELDFTGLQLYHEHER
jgi:hypothetical protein